MSDIRRILCPVDFSEFSRHALDQALAIARWYDGSVTALHVVSVVPMTDPLMAPSVIFTPEDLDQCRDELVTFVQNEAGTVPVDAKVVQDLNAQAGILAEAEAMPADLIVMGTHGRSGFERLILGSVTERVLRKAPCAVLTVPRAAPDVVPARRVGFDQILCAVDFSPSSVKALEYAASLAREAGATLTIMHVLEPVPAYEPVMDARDAIMELAQKEARARMHAMAPLDVEVREAVKSGKPYRAILQQAADDKSDLIVIGAHGGVAGLVAFGSTTNHVVREATCPVLTLRAQ
jgi:nucleotide-binding universal stress UspA family protein